MSANATSLTHHDRVQPSFLVLVLLTIWLTTLVAIPAATAGAQEATAEAEPDGTPAAGAGLDAAIAWLVGQQAADGGFPGFDGTSDPGTTCDAIYALAAAASSGLEVATALERAYAFLSERAADYAAVGTGQSAKLVLAAVAAGRDPSDVGGVRPIDLIAQGVDPQTGLYGSGVFDHALAILALAAAGQEIPAAAFDALTATQLADGAWAFDGSPAAGAGDGNTTALAVQALVAAGQNDSPLIGAAIGFLATLQAASGGFSFFPGDEPDANSTALAVQALISVGMDPAAPDLLDAAEALAAFQNPSGAFRYQDAAPDDNLFATVQAIPAQAGVPLPVMPSGGSAGTPAA
jgi:hypothetical protein